MTDAGADISYLDATELATRIRSRDLSSVEVVRHQLRRIERVNPALSAVVTISDDALDHARAADEALARGTHLGPLHGVPFTVKDSLDTARIRTARGSRLFAHYVPSSDAVAVARLRSAGAVVLGKTNLPEFSYARESDNLVFGRTVNPWNRGRTPGGSTGGEAAAIAAGLSPLGIGSDVALSIRVPAHFCGIVGLKPTHGRVPFTGHWPNTLRRYWHVGPMARTVRDVALALESMSGPDGQDGYLVSVPPPKRPAPDASLRSLRVGWLAGCGFGPVDGDTIAAVEAAAGALARSGCRVEPARIPTLEETDGNVLSATLFGAEAIPYFRRTAQGREHELHPVMQRVIAAPIPSTAEYLAAELEVERLRDAMSQYFSDHDALLCPVAPMPAPGHGIDDLLVDGVAVPNRHNVRCTVPFNLTGAPALAVPFGWSRDGLPIGVQIVGRHFDEGTVLQLGLALERARDERPYRPIP